MKRLTTVSSTAIALVTLGSIHATALLNRSGEPMAVAEVTDCDLYGWGTSGPLDFETLTLPSKSWIFTKEELAQMGLKNTDQYARKKVYILFSTHAVDSEKYFTQLDRFERWDPAQSISLPTAISAHVDRSQLEPLADKGYFIANGIISWVNVEKENKPFYELKLGSNDLSVPAAFQKQIIPRGYDATACTAEHQITITFGSRGIPWISDIRKADG